MTCRVRVRSVELSEEDVQTLKDLRLFMFIAHDQADKHGSTKGVETADRSIALLNRMIGDKS